MSVRISTNTIYNRTTAALGRQQVDLAKTQDQISSGKRIQTASDDPAGAARVVDLHYSSQLIAQIQKNQQTARDKLQGSEDAITGAINLIQEAMDTAVTVANDTNSAQDIKAIATKVRGSLQELVGLANTRDADGSYIFAGYNAGSIPFVDDGSTIVYQGDSGTREAQIGFQRHMQISEAGDDVFMNILSGNGTFEVNPTSGNTGTGIVQGANVTDPSIATSSNYAIQFTTNASGGMDFNVTNTDSGATVASGPYKDGKAIGFDGIQVTIKGKPAAGDQFDVKPSEAKSLFQIFQGFADTLDAAAASPGAYATKNSQIFKVSQELDQALEHLSTTRTKIGSRASEIDTYESIMSSSLLTLQNEIANTEDLDYSEALIRSAKQQTILQATQASYSKLVSSSLFDYIR